MMARLALAHLLPALVDTRHQYSRVFDIYVPIAVAVFGIIFISALALALRNRRRAPAHASRRHNNERLEGSYAVFLTCVVAFLLWLTFSAEHQTDVVANQEHPNVVIDVTASKWEWTFYYPAYRLTIRSGVTGDATFEVPTGQAVRFNIVSADVVHAFWIPEVRFKHDANPGMTQSQTLTFPVAGTFQGQCAEFCGLRHADMLFSVHAVSPAAFTAWARSGGRGPTP